MTSATIKLFLPLGAAKSLRTAEISNWTERLSPLPAPNSMSFWIARNSKRPASTYCLPTGGNEALAFRRNL